MLPASNPLSKIFTPFPVPPFPGLHFPLSLGNGPAQLIEVCSPQARSPPLTTLFMCASSVHLSTSPSSSQNPPSSTSEKLSGLFLFCCGFIMGPPCGPVPAPASWGLRVLVCSEKGRSGGICAVRWCSEQVHLRFVLPAGLLWHS